MRVVQTLRFLPVVAAALVAIVELLGALPAPTLPLLAFSVAIPELAPRALVIGIVVLIAVAVIARGRMRALGLAMAAIACALALVPLAQFSQTRLTADAALAHFDRGTFPPLPAPALASSVRIVKDVPVRTRDGARLAFDVYRPAGSGSHPTIVTIYGGAWIFGKRSDTAAIDMDLAEHGFTVIAVDYRHAPTYRFPTQRNDIADDLATIAREAPHLGVDPSRVAIFGRSAGAELALLAAYEPGPLHVCGVVAYYAPTDLVDGYDVPPVPDPANVRGILRAYLGTKPAGNAAGYRAASPVDLVRPGLPPTFLIIGARDLLVRPAQQAELSGALRAHDDAVVAIELPWSNHAFDVVPGGLGSTIARRETDRFLAVVLR